jgi:hypothetical protein
MTQPAVNLTQLDGALGVLPATAGGLLAVVGNSEKGPLNTPSTFGRAKELFAAFGAGPGVEALALHMMLTGKPGVFVRTAGTTAGAAGAVAHSGAGTSVVTVNTAGADKPLDDYEVIFAVVTGGTIGVAGITFKYSLDGGRNYSPVTALGVANTYTIPGSGVVLAFAAGTMLAGQTESFRTTAPKWSTAELTTALTALGNSIVTWEILEVVGALDGAAFDAIETVFAGWFLRGKYHAWMGHFRVENAAETQADYKTAFDAIFSTRATTFGAVTAGGCEVTSAISGRKYLRPHSFVTASREAAGSEEVSQADPNLGSLPVAIRDDNGNPKYHDETLNPGLDDSRAYVLRTWDNGPQGIYVNLPRLLSATGSDFKLMPHRRVMNLALGALRNYMIRRLQKPILIDKTTGFILEEEALEIEAGAEAAMSAVLLAKPKASGVQFALSRNDNLAMTSTLTGDARVIPLIYPEAINLNVGFVNPALQIQKVG